jgi:hypothetical protein
MNNLLLILTLLASSVNADEVTIPNQILSPGKADPSLTKEVICDDGFRTGDYRNVSTALKNRVYIEYGIKAKEGYCSNGQGCEVDHIIPLYLGGSNDITNLWPQPYEGKWNAHMKDNLEMKLHKLVCSGAITLEDAQKEISTDWIKAYNKYALVH